MTLSAYRRLAFLATLTAMALFALVVVRPADAKVKAGSQVFEGIVAHVSTNNLKVTNPKTHETVSFLLVPRFKKIFDTKTTQQTTLHNGQYVKVYYDQKAMGARHADHILVLNDANETTKKMKS